MTEAPLLYVSSKNLRSLNEADHVSVVFPYCLGLGNRFTRWQHLSEGATRSAKTVHLAGFLRHLVAQAG